MSIAARRWAGQLGLNDAVRLLEQTLEEEKKTDATLTKVAEAVVNRQVEAAQSQDRRRAVMEQTSIQ